MKKQKCIFLDRDGTINKEVDYLYKVEDFQFIKGSDKAINLFNKLDYLVIVMTNQSGIARGYYTEEDLKILHRHIDKVLEKSNTKINAYYYCPHHPSEGLEKYRVKCLCRKPELAMFLKAKEDFNIDFENSIIVGDKISDIEAGFRLGMESILVRSGHGKVEEKNTYGKINIYENLLDFAKSLEK